MKIAEFEARGGWEQIAREVLRNGHIERACGFGSASVEDIVQDAKVWVLEHFEQFAEQCPTGLDTVEYIVRQAVKRGIAAARSARNGYSTRNGRPILHIRESDYIGEDGSSYFEKQLPRVQPTVDHDEYFPADIADRAKAFEGALVEADSPLLPAYISAQTDALGYCPRDLKALQYAVEVYEREGRIPSSRSIEEMPTHSWSQLVRAEEDMVWSDEMLRSFSAWQASEDKLAHALSKSDKKYATKAGSGKAYIIPVKVSTNLGQGVAVMATSPYLPPKVVAA